MADNNPFRPAEQVAPKIKAFVFGASGVGKTYLALTAPGKIAAIDTEGGMAFYAKRAGKGQLSTFDVLPTKTFRDVLAGVRFVKEHPAAYATLVIDPITVIYETLQDAAQIRRATQRNDQDADLEMLDWQRIKRAYKALMTELVNLPVHVIVVARERDETEKRGKENVKIGVKPDAEKGTAYFFDTVVHLVPSDGGREAIVLKDRTGVHALNVRIENPTFDSLFGAAIKAGRKDTGERAVQDDVEAAQIDAATEQQRDPEPQGGEVEELLGVLTKEGNIKVGGAMGYRLEPRQTPDGMALGFALDVDGKRDIPQVLIDPPLAADVIDATGGKPETLAGKWAQVRGRLYNVIQPGRRSFYRLRVQAIETKDWRLPAEPSEAPAAGTFAPDVEAELDAAVPA